MRAGDGSRFNSVMVTLVKVEMVINVGMELVIVETTVREKTLSS